MYSLGHSTRTLDELVELLSSEGVEVLCDIRHFPGSRRNPQFNRDALARDLPEQGIAYLWLGETLGGFRKGGYEAWMETEEFARGIAELEDVAAERTAAFMCAEAVPWKCHRRFVARALARRGHATAHLLAPGRVAWEETPLSPPDP